MMDVYDFILQGHHETFTPGNLRGLHYKPGDMTFLHRFEACTYKSSPHTYMMVSKVQLFSGELLIYYRNMEEVFQESCWALATQ